MVHKRYERKPHRAPKVQDGDYHPLDKILSAFTFRDLQIFKNIILTLVQHNSSPAQVVEYVDIRSIGMHPPMRLNCPDCNFLMGMTPINNAPERMYGAETDRIWLICPRCDRDFTAPDMRELAAKYTAAIRERDDLFKGRDPQ